MRPALLVELTPGGGDVAGAEDLLFAGIPGVDLGDCVGDTDGGGGRSGATAVPDPVDRCEEFHAVGRFEAFD